MPAKAPPPAETPASERPNAERPKDLSHIRVGPPFEGKTGGRCLVCKQPTKGKTAHIVENTRADTRKAICDNCLEDDPELKARQQTDDLNSFLSA